MGFTSRREVERQKAIWKAGMRVELVCMDDLQAPPVGTRGTVKGVDDMGDVMIAWDNGSSLKAVYGVDIIKEVRE